MVALDADTGKLKWHFQFSPHDEFDYDSVQVPVLADIEWKGQPRKVMLWANRNGFFYVLDRTTGKFLLGKPFVEVNWATGFDEAGRPMRVPGKLPTPEGTLIYPGQSGRHQLVFAVVQSAHRVVLHPDVGELFVGVSSRPRLIMWKGSVIRQLAALADRRHAGARATINTHGRRRLRSRARLRPQNRRPQMGVQDDRRHRRVLTTASDLLFSGGREGYF